MGNKPSSSTKEISDSSTKEILRSLKIKSRCLSHCIEEQSGRLQSTRREFPSIVEDYSLQTIKIAHSEMEEMEFLDMKNDDSNILVRDILIKIRTMLYVEIDLTIKSTGSISENTLEEEHYLRNPKFSIPEQEKYDLLGKQKVLNYLNVKCRNILYLKYNIF